ncbi:MAG TPA: hypothetical protein PKD15_00710 [Candidatus Saccharibacteria bacterium]|nr:hypothetical protein [Candidatus Saccharibacteria bacterium]
MKTKQQPKTEIPQWKIDQMYARRFKRFGRLISSDRLSLGIKEFKRQHKGDSKAIKAYKEGIWNAMKNVAVK